MDFLNKLGKKASETYQVTKEKTVKFSNEMKLKGKINEAKTNIIQMYKEIGELVYTEYKDNSDNKREEIELKCQVISNLNDEISKLESEILALNETKKCVGCGEEIDSKADFCPKCGKQQPKVEEEKIEVEENVDEEVKEAEVTEIKDVQNIEEEHDDE